LRFASAEGFRVSGQLSDQTVVMKVHDGKKAVIAQDARIRPLQKRSPYVAPVLLAQNRVGDKPHKPPVQI
jgi:hypothetical protein